MTSAMRLKQLWLPLGVALLIIAPGLGLRVSGADVSAVAGTALFGLAILAAGFLLSWGAETAEEYMSPGLVLALVAMITVLPEYAVDFYFAFQAGRDPSGGYVAYAAANMTGANRMLVGLAWPVMVLLNWWRTRDRKIALAPVNAIEVGFLGIASVYAFVIVFKNSIGLLDSAVLFALFGFYLFRVGRAPKPEGEEEKEAESPGPPAVLVVLPARRRWALIGFMVVVAIVTILAVAEPFAESLIESGRALNIDEFLLIQWIAPIASEAPAIVIAVLFVLNRRAGAALIAMISDKINQWTLLVGMLPLAMSIGAGALTALPLDARQHEEFFLTAAQSLFGLALILRLRLTTPGALALIVLFVGQIGVSFWYRGDLKTEIAILTAIAWGYLLLAAVIAALSWRSLLNAGQAIWANRTLNDAKPEPARTT